MPAPSTQVQELFRSSIVWDNHSCMPLRTDAGFLSELERYRAIGVNVVSLNVGFAEMSLAEHIRILSFMRNWLSLRPDAYRLVSSIEDIRRCKRDGRLGVVFDVEGMCPVQDEPGLVQTFYELGVRWMLIAYNRNNAAGGGCQDEDCGLTAKGRAIIDEMARVGMVLCCSHTGYRTALEAMEYSKNPVIFSHSNPRALRDHERNIPDELIRACARTGGVIDLNGIGIFLGDNDSSTETLLRHIEYVAGLVGPEHVGLGLDYVFDRAELDQYVRDHPELFPPEKGYGGGMAIVELEQFPLIAEGLLKRGFTDQQVRGVLGENNLRVAAQVWR